LRHSSQNLAEYPKSLVPLQLLHTFAASKRQIIHADHLQKYQFINKEEYEKDVVYGFSSHDVKRVVRCMQQ
jgi:hypothetical protein